MYTQSINTKSVTMIGGRTYLIIIIIKSGTKQRQLIANDNGDNGGWSFCENT